MLISLVFMYIEAYFWTGLSLFDTTGDNDIH